VRAPKEHHQIKRGITEITFTQISFSGFSRWGSRHWAHWEYSGETVLYEPTPIQSYELLGYGCETRLP